MERDGKHLSSKPMDRAFLVEHSRNCTMGGILTHFPGSYLYQGSPDWITSTVVLWQHQGRRGNILQFRVGEQVHSYMYSMMQRLGISHFSCTDTSEIANTLCPSLCEQENSVPTWYIVMERRNAEKHRHACASQRYSQSGVGTPRFGLGRLLYDVLLLYDIT